MSNKRLWLGLTTMIILQIAVSNLLTLVSPDQVRFETLQFVLATFLAATAGGFVARKGFMLPAFGAWLIVWVAITYVHYRVVASVAPVSMFHSLRYTWVAFALSGAAAGVGAHVGQTLAARRKALS